MLLARFIGKKGTFYYYYVHFRVGTRHVNFVQQETRNIVILWTEKHSSGYMECSFNVEDLVYTVHKERSTIRTGVAYTNYRKWHKNKNSKGLP